MWIETWCRLELDYQYETPIVLMLRPRSGMGQWVAEESYRLTPQLHDVTTFTDPFGNLCQRMTIPPDGFVLETTTLVQTAPGPDVGHREPFVPVTELPEDVIAYLRPSRYCESDRLGKKALQIAGAGLSGYEQASAIDRWIFENVTYAPGSSAEPLSAVEIMQAGSGVCKDLAHLGIAMCRSISIPARFVVGYLHGLEPMDLHAWFEVYVGNRWFTLDPTQASLDGARVAVAYGRDAADVAIYHQFGLPARYTDMQVTVKQVTRDER